MTGSRIHANRGMSFERMVSGTNRVYESEGLAVVRKIPTPMGFDPATGKVFYRAKSTVDHLGFDCRTGLHIAIEDKIIQSRKSGSPPGRYRLDKRYLHQIDYLVKVVEAGGYGFLLIHDGRIGKTFKVPPQPFLDDLTVQLTDFPAVPRGKGWKMIDYYKLMREADKV